MKLIWNPWLTMLPVLGVIAVVFSFVGTVVNSASQRVVAALHPGAVVEPIATNSFGSSLTVGLCRGVAVICAGFFALTLFRYRRFKRAVNAIRGAGGRVDFSWGLPDWKQFGWPEVVVDLTKASLENVEPIRFSHIPRLVTLRLPEATVSEIQFAEIAKVSELRSLDASATLVDESQLKLLAKLRQLKTLLLNVSALPEEAGETLERLASLLQLELFGQPLTESGGPYQTPIDES